ncbi:MAG: hypothetical protein WAZ14_02760 [Patescibacteria group bacterium]
MYIVMCCVPTHNKGKIYTVQVMHGNAYRHPAENTVVIIGHRPNQASGHELAVHVHAYIKEDPAASADPLPETSTYYIVKEIVYTNGSKHRLIDKNQVVTEGEKFRIAATGWFSVLCGFSTEAAAKAQQNELSRTLIVAALRDGMTVKNFVPRLQEQVAVIARNL